jgi:hypothetical protein
VPQLDAPLDQGTAANRDCQRWDAASGINNDFKIQKGRTKSASRIARAGLLPDTILYNKVKLGFEAHQAVWLKAIGASMKSAIGESEILNRMFREQEIQRKLTT